MLRRRDKIHPPLKNFASQKVKCCHLSTNQMSSTSVSTLFQKTFHKILYPISSPITPIQAFSAIRGVPIEKCQTTLYNEAILLHQTNTPRVITGSSNIPNAGTGLFASSALRKGTLLATYGGTYIPPIPTNIGSTDSCMSSSEGSSEGLLQAELKGDYIIRCDGGGWIDGQYHTHDTHDVAHLANHSTKPNAVVLTIYDFPNHLGVQSMPRNSKWYYCSEEQKVIRIPKNLRLKTMALVSIKNIKEGEEILFDYDINPPHNHPPWYIATSERERLNYLKEITSCHK